MTHRPISFPSFFPEKMPSNHIAIWTSNATLELHSNFLWAAKINVMFHVSQENSLCWLHSSCGDLCYYFKHKRSETTESQLVAANGDTAPGLVQQVWGASSEDSGYLLWGSTGPKCSSPTARLGSPSATTMWPFPTSQWAPVIFLLKFCQWFCISKECLITILITAQISHLFLNSALKSRIFFKAD